MDGARSTSSRKIAAQASQTIIDQIIIVPPRIMRFFQHNRGAISGKHAGIVARYQRFVLREGPLCCGAA